MPNSDQEITHFGFKDVTKTQKSGMVQDVFNSVSPKYDLMNDLMSLRLHRYWKDCLLNWLSPQKNTALLDVAGGTGDIAVRYSQRGGGAAVVCDINEQMIDQGRVRSHGLSGTPNIQWVCGDAEALPFPNQSFDIYTIAFGLRNVTNIEKALAEAWRVLRPGGRFMCLEFSQFSISALRPLYELYSFKVLPEIGRVVAKDKDAYLYFAESIRKFPNQYQFLKLMKDARLENTTYRNLSGGIVAIHSGWRF